MPRKNPSYDPEFWAGYKDERNARRRERYANDPAYRARQHEIAAKSRAKARAAKEAERGPLTVTVDGVDRPALTTNEVCEQIGIDPKRIKYFQRSGYCPTALVTKPVRLYTQKQADMLHNLQNFLAAQPGRMTKAEQVKLRKITETIHNDWRK